MSGAPNAAWNATSTSRLPSHVTELTMTSVLSASMDAFNMHCVYIYIYIYSMYIILYIYVCVLVCLFVFLYPANIHHVQSPSTSWFSCLRQLFVVNLGSCSASFWTKEGWQAFASRQNVWNGNWVCILMLFYFRGHAVQHQSLTTHHCFSKPLMVSSYFD